MPPICSRSMGSVRKSDIEVKIELPWVRAQPDRVDLMLALVLEPRVDHIFSEDIASAQELVVGLERVQRLIERTRHLADVLRFLARQRNLPAQLVIVC